MSLKEVSGELHDRLEKAKEVLLSNKGTLRIISHYDADGICAAGVLCHAFSREKLRFHVSLTSSLSDEHVDLLKKENYSLTIFCDMGSSHLKALSQFEGDVIILDHHRAPSDSMDPLLINPNFFGMDGTYDMCGSSLAFALSDVLNQDNWDLSALALAGVVGDKQHLSGLSGFNSQMVEIAKEKGIVEEKRMLKLNGGKLITQLMEGLDPYIRGVSGREDTVLEFLNSMKLDPAKKTEDLDVHEKRLLASAVIVKLLAQNVRPELAEGFVTYKYWLPQWNLYANDLSNYINSCGRMDYMGTGLALCMGDAKALEKAKELRKTYKDEVRKGLFKLESEGPHDMKNIQFFYTDNPSLAGAHAGLGMMYLFDQEKPVFALSMLETETKVSSRGTGYLISKGLDLAEACRDAADEVGGKGGGHPIASGATIPKGKEEAFLNRLDEIVGKQFEDEQGK